ncbi:MAG: hypothetical protein LBT97_00770 [Planctomycetota bacterium]|jgi:predicted ABC-type sugar transport system permease subunit|nr:hypothetical protein [Planctomycetota bacterium]
MMKNRNLVIWLLDYGIVAILAALIVFFSTQSSNFLKWTTMITILKQVSIISIISVGMGFVILTAGIDLSVGSIACVTSVTAAMLMKYGVSLPLSYLPAVFLATVYGCFRGEIVRDEAIIASIRTALEMESDTLTELLDNFDADQALRAVRAIMECTGTIHLSGCGTSGQAAKESVLGVVP